MGIEQDILGFTEQGEVILKYTLSNSSTVKVALTNVGAAIMSCEVTCADGVVREMILGYPSYRDYLSEGLSMGKCVGRYAGRIAKGRLVIGDNSYKLSSNDGMSHLNGGMNSFGSKIWSARTEGDMVVFSYVSSANEEGYPAEFGVEVGYLLSEDNVLSITIVGESDDDTVVNIAPYIYFNLNGEGDAMDMELKINSSLYVPLDGRKLSKGATCGVEDSAYDFTKFKSINNAAQGLEYGYDDYFIVDNHIADALNDVCTLRSAKTGVELNIQSSQKALYMSSCYEIEGCALGRDGKELKNGEALLLSPQNINIDGSFGDVILKRGEIYHHQTNYVFSNLNNKNLKDE